MKKKLSLLSAALVLSLIFASCSMFEDAGERATSKVSFEVSSELLRSVIEKSRNSNTNNSREVGDQIQFYETIVNLSGGSYTKTLTDTFPSDNEKTKLPDEIKSQKFVFPSVPVGTTVKAEVYIDYVMLYEEDTGKIFEDRQHKYKGTSNSLTVKKDGNNELHISLMSYYDEIPLTLTLSFDGAMPENFDSARVFALKANSEQVKDFYQNFGSRNISADTLMNLEELGHNGEGNGWWYEDDTEDKQVHIDTEKNKLELSGSMYMTQEEKLIFVVQAWFRPVNAVLAPDDYSYIGFADVDSLSALNASAVYSSKDGVTANLKLTKAKAETIYALYDKSGYDYFIYPSKDNNLEYLNPNDSFVQENGIKAYNNSFAYDSQGNLYVLTYDLASGVSYIKSGDKTVALDLKMEDGAGQEQSVNPSAITIDIASDTMYAYYTEQGELHIYKFPDLISKGDASFNYISGFSIYFGDLIYNGSNQNDIIVVNNGIVYGFGCHGRTVYDSFEGLYSQLYKIDFSKTELIGEKLKYIAEALHFDDNFDSFGISKGAEVTDLLYQDGAIYMLVSEKGSDYTPVNYISSRGSIIKYVVKDGTFTSKSLTRTYDLSGGFLAAADSTSGRFYTCENQSDMSDANSYITEFKPSDLGRQFLINAPYVNEKADAAGPTKFIAIKPKKLVIADSGIAFYTNSLGVLYKKKVNRVIEVNLKDLSMQDAKVTDVQVEFSTNYPEEAFSGITKTMSFDGSENVYIYKQYPTPSWNHVSEGTYEMRPIIFEQ